MTYFHFLCPSSMFLVYFIISILTSSSLFISLVNSFDP